MGEITGGEGFGGEAAQEAVDTPVTESAGESVGVPAEEAAAQEAAAQEATAQEATAHEATAQQATAQEATAEEAAAQEAAAQEAAVQEAAAQEAAAQEAAVQEAGAQEAAAQEAAAQEAAAQEAACLEQERQDDEAQAERAAEEVRQIERIQEDAMMLGEHLSQGHGYSEHHTQFGDSITRQEYADIAAGIIAQPDEARMLPRDRAGFWSDQHQAAVFLDERSEDGGTMFKPDNGKAYFDGQ